MGGCGSSVHHSPLLFLSLFLREAILHLLPQSRRRAANRSPQCTPARRSHVSLVPERIALFRPQPYMQILYPVPQMWQLAE